jgi:energy-coupling factor transporter ATP-binding protein EcfA2
MALHFQFLGDIDALMIWDEYSARDGAGNYLGFSDLEKQWNRFRLNHPNPITFASVYQKLKKPELTEADILEEAKPIQYDLDKPKPIRYLLNGFMTEGITSIAGASGAGKTTMVVELASIVAHLCDESKVSDHLDKHFLKVRGRRKVIHFTEHADQVEQVLYGKRKFGKNHSAITCGTEEANEWYIVVPTKKYTAIQLAGLVSGYSKKHTVTWPTGRFDQSGNEINVEMPPLLIFDTASASFALDDENSNSEQSKMIASIKEVIRGLKSSIWIITHVAKAAKMLDLKQQSSRGAGAIEADVQTAASLGREIGAECSILSITKNRIQTKFDEINFKPTFHSLQVEDEWGDWQEVTYITGELTKSTSVERIQQKVDSKKEGAELAKKYSIKQRAISIIDLLKNTAGKELYNQEDLQDLLGGNVAINRAATGLLKARGYIVNKKLDKAESDANGGKRKAIVLTLKPLDESMLEDGNV